MGEMADLALEEVMQMEDLRDRFRANEFNLNEAYEMGLVDETGTDFGDPTRYEE